ncbi:MAG TPA: hypothetical protein VFS43_22185 [Polyangiaceae bacterium]|nr:hypothetical protein [Polyangiaceae bacterium]
MVASELPRERATLLVRLMAAGPLLAQAIEELGALPPDAHERAVAEQIRLALEHALGKKPKPTPEEQEFLVKIHTSWHKEREQGRTEGRAEGRAEQAARAVLTVLRVRGLEVRDEARERIVAETDPERLERWHEGAGRRLDRRGVCRVRAELRRLGPSREGVNADEIFFAPRASP